MMQASLLNVLRSKCEFMACSVASSGLGPGSDEFDNIREKVVAALQVHVGKLENIGMSESSVFEDFG